MRKDRMLRLEGPDAIDAYIMLPGAAKRVHREWWRSGRAFGYINGKMLVATDDTVVHFQLGMPDNNTIGAEFDDVNRKSMRLPGRIWPELKMISFWKYPRDKAELDRVISDINRVGRGIRINGSWMVEVNPKIGKPNSHPDGEEWQDGYGLLDDTLTDHAELIPIKDYKGSEDTKPGPEHHVASPLKKKQRTVPSGQGSKKRLPGQRTGEVPAAARARNQQEFIDLDAVEAFGRLHESTTLSGAYYADSGEPVSGFLPGGFTRQINHPKGKPEHWFHQGGYTQMHFPRADYIYGDKDKGDDVWQVKKKVTPTTVSTVRTEKELSKATTGGVEFEKPHFDTSDRRVKLHQADVDTLHTVTKADQQVTAPMNSVSQNAAAPDQSQASPRRGKPNAPAAKRYTLKYMYNIKGK